MPETDTILLGTTILVCGSCFSLERGFPMANWFRTNQADNADNLRVRVCGNEQCYPGKVNGPVVKDRYSIHYIHKGRGIYKIKGKTYELEEGQGFLIVPNQIVYYEANKRDPWHYSWIGFHGYKSESYLQQAGLSADSPIFRTQNPQIADCFQQMRDVQESKAKELRLTSLLCLILSLLIEEAPVETKAARSDRELYIANVVDFIANNYYRTLSIAEVSRHIGLDQSYLGALFKAHTRMTLQQFLVHYRLERACGLLHSTSFPISDIARSVGYENPLVFSRVFKKVKGMSPVQYRNSGKV
jgi:AraC-like DNA-binding protein